MNRHIGIVAGSAEGAALCYRTICSEAPAIMGENNHPEITMNSVPLAEHMRHIRENDWEALAETLAISARKVSQAGADFAIKEKAEFLFLLKRQEGKLTPYWYPLAPTNEQLRPDKDGWLDWVKDFLQSQNGKG